MNYKTKCKYRDFYPLQTDEDEFCLERHTLKQTIKLEPDGLS